MRAITILLCIIALAAGVMASSVIFGDEPEVIINGSCTTDTDCMLKFGGDGGPGVYE